MRSQGNTQFQSMQQWPTKQRWWVSPGVASLFPDLPTIFATSGKCISSDPISEVIYLKHHGVGYYIKRYHRAGKHLQNWVGMPRARTEWQSLEYFKQLGLPSIELVASGAEHRGIRYVRGALITRELSHSEDLESIAKNNQALFNKVHWRHSVLRQTARGLATLHADGFCHGDLFWRNLLVSGTSSRPLVHFFDCPQGARWWGPFLTHRRIKDLACFDKLGEKQLSRTDRLRFYLSYRRHKTLSASDKREIRRVLAFFDRKKRKKARKRALQTA